MIFGGKTWILIIGEGTLTHALVSSSHIETALKKERINSQDLIIFGLLYKQYSSQNIDICHLDSNGTKSEKRTRQLLTLVVLLASVVVPAIQISVNTLSEHCSCKGQS